MQGDMGRTGLRDRLRVAVAFLPPFSTTYAENNSIHIYHSKGRESNSKLVFFGFQVDVYDMLRDDEFVFVIPLKCIFPTFRRHVRKS